MGQRSAKQNARDAGEASSSEVSQIADGSLAVTAVVAESPSADLGRLIVRSFVVPSPSREQVRVRVVAAGVNPVDWKRPTFIGGGSGGEAMSSDIPLPFKRDGRYGLPPFAYPCVLGCDGAGIVESIGCEEFAEGHGIKLGDRVLFHQDITTAHGTFAEASLVDVVSACVIPPQLSFEEAAALPCAGWTAYVALFDKLGIQPKRSILINGAAGGVGSFAVQLAKHSGCFVFATCSPHNVHYVRALGADVVIDYRSDDVVERVLRETGNYGVDYVLETVNPSLGNKHAEALRFGGALCQISGVAKEVPEFFFIRQLSLHYVFLGGLHGSPLTKPILRQIGESMLALYAANAFKVDYEKVPFNKVREALELLKQGHTRGKIVVEVGRTGK
jgi:NADPH:quinone reductase-like Zn-dependent oxidoreductase